MHKALWFRSCGVVNEHAEGHCGCMCPDTGHSRMLLPPPLPLAATATPTCRYCHSHFPLLPLPATATPTCCYCHSHFLLLPLLVLDTCYPRLIPAVPSSTASSVALAGGHGGDHRAPPRLVVLPLLLLLLLALATGVAGPQQAMAQVGGWVGGWVGGCRSFMLGSQGGFLTCSGWSSRGAEKPEVSLLRY